MTQSTAGKGWQNWQIGPAVKTDGEGRRTTSHLNLTVPLETPPEPKQDPVPDGKSKRSRKPNRRRPKNAKLTPAQAVIARRYPAGDPIADIAEEAGVVFGSVKVIACLLGVKRPPRPPKPVYRKPPPPYAGYDPHERGW